MSKLYQIVNLFSNVHAALSYWSLLQNQSVYILLYPMLIFNSIRCDIFLRRLLWTDLWCHCHLNRASLLIAFKIYFSIQLCTYKVRIKSALSRRDYHMRQCPSLLKGWKNYYFFPNLCVARCSWKEIRSVWHYLLLTYLLLLLPVLTNWLFLGSQVKLTDL